MWWMWGNEKRTLNFLNWCNTSPSIPFGKLVTHGLLKERERHRGTGKRGIPFIKPCVYRKGKELLMKSPKRTINHIWRSYFYQKRCFKIKEADGRNQSIPHERIKYNSTSSIMVTERFGYDLVCWSIFSSSFIRPCDYSRLLSILSPFEDASKTIETIDISYRSLKHI